MGLLKTTLIFCGVIFGLIFTLKGFVKVKLEGFRLNFKDLFTNVPFKESSGGLLVIEGIISLLLSLVLYLLWKQ